MPIKKKKGGPVKRYSEVDGWNPVPNFLANIKEGKMVIEIDLTKDQGPSNSGKTTIVCSTRGAVRIPGTDIDINVNAYRKK